MNKAYVLLSGGVDSSTCLGIAKERHGEAVAVSLLYGQRHHKEVNQAAAVASALGCEHIVRDITSAMSVGGLTDSDLVIPSLSYADLPEGVSPTYVPFRNGLFISVLAGMAQADPDATHIYHGAHAEDAENDAYPDCSVPFMQNMEVAVRIGTYEKVKLETPLVKLKKHEVVSLGQTVNVPWELTWSCYEGGEHHCGVCPTCRARKEAFELANVEDPTVYMA